MRLLVLEDDIRFGDLLQHHLQAAGFAADITRSIAEFEEAAAHEVHSLYMIDLGLPDGDGLDLVARLRASRLTLPILIATARSAVRDRVAGLDRGADDYIVKPFNVTELLARVRALLRRAPELKSQQLQAGRLVLDCETGDIRFDGTAIGLSPGERRLLALLIRRLGRVVPKEYLEDFVHGVHGDSSPNAIEQLVSRLRRSLGAGAMGIELRTIRGTGYVLEETGP